MIQLAILPMALRAEPAAVVSDFGAAFEKLFELGLPDPGGATYIKFERAETRARNDGWVQMEQVRAMGRTWDTGAKGNAWLLPGAKDGSGTIIFGGYKKFDVARTKKRSGLMRALIGEPKAPQGGGVAGSWVEVPVDQEVKRIVTALDKLARAGQVFDADRWEYDTSAPSQAASLLALAAQIHRAGHEDEGNRLAGKLLTLAPEPIKVIDGVIGRLAGDEYDTLVKTFFEDRDWEKYHEGLKAVYAKYPRGWEARLGVAMLLPQVEKQASGLIARPAPWPGVEFNPEAVEILDGLLRQEEPIVVDARGCWLITSAGDLQNRRDGGSRPWLSKLCALGMDGFIAAANVAADETMIATTMQANAYHDPYGGLYGGWSSDESLEDQARMAYDSLKRPCTRGEIARKIILATLPAELDEYRLMQPAELREAAHQWWLEHRDDSSAELARHLLEAGDWGQRQNAVNALITSGGDADARLVEEFILDGGDSLSEHIHIVNSYLSARRGKAREFFERYSALLKAEVGNDPNNERWEIREAGGVDKLLKKLSVLVDEVSPDKIFANVASGKTELDDALQKLEVAIPEGGLVEHLPGLIKLARQQANVEDRIKLLDTVQGWRSGRGSRLGADKIFSSKRLGGDELEKLIEQSKPDWEFLIGDEKRYGDVKRLAASPSAGAFAAWTMELIYFPEHGDAIQQLYRVMEVDDVWKFMENRAAEVLEKGAGAEFPSADRVTEARRKEMRDQIAKLDPEAIVAYQDGCSLSEKLAWTEVIEGFGDEIPKGVEDLSNMVPRVLWRNPYDADESFRKQFEELVVLKEIDVAMISALVEFLLENADTAHNAVPMLRRSEGIPLNLQVWGADAYSGWLDSILQDATNPLVDESATKLAGLRVWADGPQVQATRYSPAKDVDGDVDEIEVAAEVLQSQLAEGKKQISAVFYSETAANFKHRTEKILKEAELEP